MTIRVGTVEIKDPVILAPMSGVTDMPFRRLVKRYGSGLVVSEMIASVAMINATRRSMKMATNCAEEHPMSVQLAGCEAHVMAEAARLNEVSRISRLVIYPQCKGSRQHSGYCQW